MTLAIVIVTWNSREDVRACLRSLGSPPPEWQIHVVDNASTDGTLDVVRGEFPYVRVHANAENSGFARANNPVIAGTDTEFVLLLNPDTECSPAAIEAALQEMERHPRAGVVAVQLRNSDGSLQPSCGRFPTPWRNFLQISELGALLPVSWRSRHLLSVWWEHDEPRAVDWVMGAFMLVRRSTILSAGLLSDGYFLYSAAIDRVDGAAPKRALATGIVPGPRPPSEPCGTPCAVPWTAAPR
jgi:GT2 family glycosyltransferase